tara:strand:+ start:242 stop:448 length:207 start_codon:yes stop_codon:yes gene_type:complete
MSDQDNKLYLLLGEIRGDIKSLMQSASDQGTRLDSHSNRITVVERFQWKLAGGAVALSTAIGFVTKFI